MHKLFTKQYVSTLVYPSLYTLDFRLELVIIVKKERNFTCDFKSYLYYRSNLNLTKTSQSSTTTK